MTNLVLGIVGSMRCRTTKQYLRNSLFGGGHESKCVSCSKVLLSAITFTIGVYSISVDDSVVPEWVAAFCHICDIFCHGIVTAALAGLLYDAALAIKMCSFCQFITAFLLCRDDME